MNRTRARSLSRGRSGGGEVDGSVPTAVDVAFGFFDGSAKGNPGQGGCGYLLVAEKPCPLVLAVGAVSLGERVSSNGAEYGGVLKLLECALACGVKQLYVLGDSQVVVEQNTPRGGGRRGFVRNAEVLVGFRDQVQELVGRFQDRVSFLHIPRARNGFADKLARVGSGTLGVNLCWSVGSGSADPRLEVQVAVARVGDWIRLGRSEVCSVEQSDEESDVGEGEGTVEVRSVRGRVVSVDISCSDDGEACESGAGAARDGSGAGAAESEHGGIAWPAVGSGLNGWSEGWEAIDRLTAFDCQECVFQLLDFIPSVFAEVWVEAVALVLREWQDAGNDVVKRDRALKWWIVLPSVLLRKVGRGGRRGEWVFGARFAAWQEGCYGQLVKWWLIDKAKVRDFVPGGVSGEEDTVGVVAGMVAQGEISRAVRRATSLGVASTSSSEVVEQLSAKHPARHQEIPSRESFVVDEELPRVRVDMVGVLGSLPRKGSPGLSGWRNMHLKVLVRSWRSELARSVLKRVQKFADAWVDGELPRWLYALMSRVRCVALVKGVGSAGGVPDCRPIAVGEVWRRAIHKAVAVSVRESAEGVFFPQQVAVGVAGGMSKMVFGMRLLLEAHPEWALVKVDLKNAFNEVDRVKVLRALSGFRDLRGLLRVMWATLQPKSEVFFHGVKRGRLVKAPFTSQAGLQQGDALSCIGMCAVMQKAVVEADSALLEVGGACRACMDDVVMVGPKEVLAVVVERYRSRVLELTGASISPAKSCQFSFAEGRVGVDWLQEGVVKRDGVVVGRGVSVLGVPVGTDGFIGESLRVKVDEVVSNIQHISNMLLPCHLQSLWALLYYSFNAQFVFWIQHVWGGVVRDAAGRIDVVVADVVRQLFGVAIDDLSWRRVRLPAALDGCGVRSLVELGPAAFLGAFLQSVPSCLDSSDGSERGFLPQLTDVLGASVVAPLGVAGRWRGFLQRGLPTAKAFAEAWGLLQAEVGGHSQRDDLLSAPVEDVEVSRHAKRGLQRLLTWGREKVARDKLAGLVDGLPGWDPRKLSLRSVDNFSRMWVGAWPCRECRLLNVEFREVATAYLGLDSPVCIPIVGEVIGTRGLKVDRGGFALTTAQLKGDGWRKQHDALKWCVADMARAAEVATEVEVYGLFASVISRRPRDGRLEGRRLQGMVPDLLLELGGRPKLWDVKTLHCGRSTYQWETRRPTKRAVERRAAEVPHGCVVDAVKLDRDLNNIPSNVRGPVQRRLEEYGEVTGLVFGAFGEVSESVAVLVRSLARAAAARSHVVVEPNQVQERGRCLEWVFRRRLAMVGWRASAHLRLSRARFAGVQGRIAERRRVEARRMREEVAEGMVDFRLQRWMLGGRCTGLVG